MRAEIVLPTGRFLGRALFERRFGPVVVTETVYDAREVLPEHVHAAANLFLVTEGYLGEGLGSLTSTHRPGTVVFHPNGVAHRTRACGAPARVLNLALDEAWFAPERERLALTTPRRALPAGIGARLLRAMRFEGEPLEVEGLVCELLLCLARTRPRVRRAPPAWLPRAERYLRERLSGTPSLSELAAELGLERTHVTRAFRRHLGLSVGEWVRHERVRRAELLLADRRLSLAEIALCAGFADQSHFNRVFKAHHGIAPGLFRAELVAG
jgi:AraC family transcriptional regulator